MINLVIHVLCCNGEATLGTTLASLPRGVPGTSEVEWMVIGEDSDYRTADIVRLHGVDHIVRLPRNREPAWVSDASLEASLIAVCGEPLCGVRSGLSGRVSGAVRILPARRREGR